MAGHRKLRRPVTPLSAYMRHAIRALASSFVVAVVAVVAAPANAIAGEPAASVRELSWIAGRWKAVMDKDVSVEETWTQPLAGSIASLVRITRANATDTIEMIVIAEEGGSLVLRIQQWSLDYKPRTDPQVMRLAELGKDSVVFEAANKDRKSVV